MSSCKKSEKPARSNNKIHNVVVISDTHFGSFLALWPREGFKIDYENVILPSTVQRKLTEHWDKFWEWVEEACGGEPYHLVHNGDIIEGSHHRSKGGLSSIEDQIKLGYQMMLPVVERVKSLGGKYFQVRGTEAHVGDEARDEENLARQLGAIPNETGQYARWDLWLDLHGSLIQFLHHVGTISSSAYEATAVYKELTESYVEAARWGQQPPDMICRAHRHRYLEVKVQTDRGRGIGIVGPGWQLKTPFAYRIAGARVSMPQFGGFVIRKSSDGVLYTKEKVWTIERSKTELA